MIHGYEQFAHNVSLLLVGTEHDGLGHSSYHLQHLRDAVGNHFLPFGNVNLASEAVAGEDAFLYLLAKEVLFSFFSHITLHIDIDKRLGDTVGS